MKSTKNRHSPHQTPKIVKDLYRKLSRVDFSRAPYRGIVARVARRRGIDRRTAHKRLWRQFDVTLAAAVWKEVVAIDEAARKALQ